MKGGVGLKTKYKTYADHRKYVKGKVKDHKKRRRKLPQARERAGTKRLKVR